MKKIVAFLCIIIVLIIGLSVYIKYNKKQTQVPVLVFHNIIPDDVKKDSNDNDTLTESEFEKEMKYLRNKGYTTITAEELYLWKSGKADLLDKSVLITFDDGYYSFKHIVQPILERYNFNAICFVIGNATDDETPEYNPKKYGTIGKDEINDHIENVEYGSHTYSLHNMNEKDVPLVKTSSKDDLEIDVKTFEKNIFKAEYLAYPYYTYTKDFINVLKENGYKLAFAGEEEMSTRGVNNYKIPRISGCKSYEEFKEIFETDKYKNKYGNGLIRKIFVNLERKLNIEL